MRPPAPYLRDEDLALGPSAQPGQGGRGLDGAEPMYLKTEDAARYLGGSVSWLLRLADLPYLKGRPNRYSRRDLDGWFERNKCNPRAA